MNNLYKKIFAVTFAAISANSALAAPIVTYTNGNGYNTTSLTQSVTTGSLMQGMTVTTCFFSGSCESSIWRGMAQGYGEARTLNWLLSIDGDTYNSPFTFSTFNSNTKVTSITLNGRPGNTVFDVNKVDMLSVGSFLGRPFEWSATNLDMNKYNVHVNYTDRLALNGVFYGDLFTVMTIKFNDSAFSGSFKFITDTDNSTSGQAIVPFDPNKVPTPSTLFLFAAGLAAMVARQKLKNR